MTDDKETEIRIPEHDFGTCCDELKEAMSGEDFEPLISVGEDGVLYMSVGLVEVDEDDPGMLDHPVFFCPVCGKGLQTAEAVREKTGDTGDDEDDEEDA